MTRFWFIRHGPTHAKAMVGWTDLPADLSDTNQIARVSAALPQDAHIISSDLIRCVDTATALQAERTRLPHDPDLREIHFGRWEMMHWREIQAQDPELIEAFWSEPGDVMAPGGESWHQTSARVSAAVDRLMIYENVVIVAHFGAILTQVQRALGISNEESLGWKIDNLSITRLDFDGTWTAHQINQTL